MTKHVYFETYGCQMNKLDTELAAQSLTDAGFETTEQVQDADLIVLNTCSVREHAEHRVVSKLGTLKPGSKRRKNGSVLALIGCMGQRQGESLFKVAPHLDIVTGTKEFVRLPELYDEVKRHERKLTALDLSDDFAYTRPAAARSERHRAFVSIMRGCDLHCTYCIVPTTRGPEESRTVRDVYEEVSRLVGDGVIEVTLLGQTVNSFGKQLPGSPDLADLLGALDQIEGLERVRFITSHPNFFQNKFWERVRDLRTFCPYVHVPAQHGADRMLKRMARMYDTATYREMVAEAREAIPHLSLASDWITGFPTETEEEHQASLNFLREIRFHQSFVFKYSPRPSTPSERRMADDVPTEVKSRRCNELLKAQDAISHELYQARIGGLEEVLVDGPSKSNAARLSGRTKDNLIVILEGGAELVGRLVPVTIDKATPHTLYGTLAGEPAPRRRSLPLATR
jgi:tRNA-2-methylthio-N6-dimethylallyladenosine synthase